MAGPDLSVVLPVFDEERCLERTFAELVPYLEGVVGEGGTFEIVAVDDGSRDRSAGILAQLAAEEPRLAWESLPSNRGKGAAVRRGMQLATGARRVFFDADLSTPLEHLPEFLAALDSGLHVAIGNRRAPGARIDRHQPWLRETLGKGFTILTRMLLAPGVHDFTCGFKAFRGEAADTIFARSTLDGWAFDAELVVIAQVHGLRLAQLPVRWHHEDDTKVRLGAAVLGSLAELVRIAARRAAGKYR